jgi:O-antigen/teichoic acid export membrane protein
VKQAKNILSKLMLLVTLPMVVMLAIVSDVIGIIVSSDWSAAQVQPAIPTGIPS